MLKEHLKSFRFGSRVSGEERAALEIVRTLAQKGFTAYFAGGCVRDMVMRKTPKDYDIATTAKPAEVESLFPKCIPVGKQFGVMIVVIGEYRFEVATFRVEAEYTDGRRPDSVSFSSPEQDAARRDFTINGLFYDPIRRKIIDYVKGREGVKNRMIQTIGNPDERFQEDYLRILRAVRFAANLSFRIEDKTWQAISRHRHKIHRVSQERIRDELIKLFTRPNAGLGLELLSQSGLLQEILPEIEAMKNVKQPPEFHPEGDVFIHTKMLLDQLKAPSVTLAFGALLHDVGKPPTFSEENGKIRFYNHAHLGAEMARSILSRLRFSNREIDDVVSCVENHMKFANVREMRIGKLKQFVSRSNFPVELDLHRIDCMASHRNLSLFRFLKKRLNDFQKEELKPKPFVSGNDLIVMGIPPSPVMKEILSDVYLEQLEGRLRTKEEMLDWVKKKYKDQIKNQ